MAKLMQLLEILFMIEDTPQSHRRWRLLVSMFLLAFLFHVGWACGYFSSLGLGNGFVKASDIVRIQLGIDTAANIAQDVQMKLLKKSIIDTRILQCKADSKRYFTQRLDDLMDEYYDATKKTYALPSCTDLQ
jgi:hypothetical protein